MIQGDTNGGRETRLSNAETKREGNKKKVGENKRGSTGKDERRKQMEEFLR